MSILIIPSNFLYFVAQKAIGSIDLQQNKDTVAILENPTLSIGT